ncbi:hypothetical protein Tco_0929868 [Tanacetum coccineum]
MFEYPRFPFTANVVIQNGATIPANEKIIQHTTLPLSKGHNILEKTDSQREVEVKDERVLAAKEKKKVQAARAAAKKKENEKRPEGGENSSRPKSKRRKTRAVRKGHTASYGEDAGDVPHHSGHMSGPRDASRNEDDVVHIFPHESADKSVHNYIDVDVSQEKEETPHIEPFVNLTNNSLNSHHKQVFADESNVTETFQPLSNPGTHHASSGGVPLSQPREILRGCHTEEGESSNAGAIYVPQPILEPENFLVVDRDDYFSLKAFDFGLSVYFRPGQVFTDVLYILLRGVPPFWMCFSACFAEFREALLRNWCCVLKSGYDVKVLVDTYDVDCPIALGEDQPSKAFILSLQLNEGALIKRCIIAIPFVDIRGIHLRMKQDYQLKAMWTAHVSSVAAAAD